MSTNDPYDQSQPPGQTPQPSASQYGTPQQQPYGTSQQQPYGAAQQPGQAMAYPPQQKTNTLAIVALVGSFFIALVGIICGHIALKQIRETGEGGRGLALAGLIIGYVGLAFWIIYAIIVILAVVASVSYS